MKIGPLYLDRALTALFVGFPLVIYRGDPKICQSIGSHIVHSNPMHHPISVSTCEHLISSHFIYMSSMHGAHSHRKRHISVRHIVSQLVFLPLPQSFWAPCKAPNSKKALGALQGAQKLCGRGRNTGCQMSAARKMETTSPVELRGALQDARQVLRGLYFCSLV